MQAIITTGGTGITSRDSTFEAISALLQKRLDGFGELFRMLSYEQIGSAAMMSRACAGLGAGRIIVSLPGSEAAVRLAMEKLIIPELGTWCNRRSDDDAGVKHGGREASSERNNYATVHIDDFARRSA